MVQYQSIFIENEIRNAVRTRFPLLSLNIYHDVSRDEYVVAIDNRSIYYSDEYQKMVMDLKISSLWPAGVDNYFFVVENTPKRIMHPDLMSFSNLGSVDWNMWNSCEATTLPKLPSRHLSNLGLAA
jgi:hypothetical protein